MLRYGEAQSIQKRNLLFTATLLAVVDMETRPTNPLATCVVRPTDHIYRKVAFHMKTVVTLLMLLVLCSPNTYPQGFIQRHLPEGAIARVGKGDVTSVRYSPDGSRLAVRGSIGIWLRDTTTYREVALLAGRSVTFSPDGATVATVAGYRAKAVRLWDAETGESIRTLTGHTDTVVRVSFSPDGKTLASGTEDSKIRLWDVKTGEPKGTLTGHTHWVDAVVFSPDGVTLASGSRDKTVRLWDAETWELDRTLTGHTGWIRSVAFSPDGKTLASSDSVNTVRMWDTVTGESKQTFTEQGRGLSVAFSPNGKTLASVKGRDPYEHTLDEWDEDDAVKLWDVATGELKRTLAVTTGEVRSVAFSSDGKTLVGGAENLHLWDVETGQIKRVLTGHSRGVPSIAFSTDGTTLASGGWDGTVRLWDAETWELKQTIATPSWVTRIAFSPDGNILASRGGDRTVLLWKLH